MTILQGPYVAALSCTDGPTVGCKNLTSWHLETFQARGATNKGIYNCRTVRGGTTTSVHGEGRASDLGCPTDAQTWSWAEAEFLRLFSAELGIQLLIHNHPDGRRLIWSCSTGTGWRPYSGVDHNNHIHAELTWAAANGGLTVAKLREMYARHTGTSGKDGFDMASLEDLRKIVAEEVHRVLVADGVAGAADLSTQQRADGSWPAGASIATIVQRIVTEVVRSEGLSGAGDYGRLADMIVAKLAAATEPGPS